MQAPTIQNRLNEEFKEAIKYRDKRKAQHSVMIMIRCGFRDQAVDSAYTLTRADL